MHLVQAEQSIVVGVPLPVSKKDRYDARGAIVVVARGTEGDDERKGAKDDDDRSRVVRHEARTAIVEAERRGARVFHRRGRHVLGVVAIEARRSDARTVLLYAPL